MVLLEKLLNNKNKLFPYYITWLIISNKLQLIKLNLKKLHNDINFIKNMKNNDVKEYYIPLWKIHFNLEYNLFLLKNYLSVETVDRIFDKRKRITNPFDNINQIIMDYELLILNLKKNKYAMVLDNGRNIAQSLRIILSYITRLKFVS